MSGPASIIGVDAVRIGRLTSDGTPDFNNPLGGFVLCGGISKFEHNFEIADGKDIFEEDAAGNACVVRKKPDRTKRATFKLTMCRSDYRLNEILGVSKNVTNGQTVVGHAVKTSAGCGGSTLGYGVSIELWSEQWDCDVPLADAQYQRVILPRCWLKPAGFTRENGVSMPEFDGFSVSNNNWGDGPFGDADVMSGVTSYCYAEIDDPQLPAQCQQGAAVGYIGIPGTAS